MSTFTLAGDILYMILDILGDEKDYNSLYQCALSSRCFTEHALTVLYKFYNLSPVRSGGPEDEQFRSRKTAIAVGEIATRKWALMWRSIVLSTLGQTCLPYYSYMRYLDHDDLTNLLESLSGTTKDDFFTPELIAFLGPQYELRGNKRLRSSKMPTVDKGIPIKICSEIVSKATSIRGLSCDVPPHVLSDWLEHLPQLQTMTIWSGGALALQAGEKIHNSCHDFKQLTIYGWDDENAESESETFFNELIPNSLEYFEIISRSRLGPRSINSLKTQLGSLSELKLTSLTIETIASLPYLTEPPALKVLSLTDSSPVARDERFYEIVSKVANWMRTFRCLERLELRRFLDDPALLSKVLVDNKIRLSSLSVAGYAMSGASAFHEALSCQENLTHLYLRGESSELPADNELLAQALAPLHKLRSLELKDISDGFTLDQAMALIPCLPNLERLWISGDYFTDEIWMTFLGLSRLQTLFIYALSEFTAEGILHFIAQLGPGNHGFTLSILNAITDKFMPETSQDVIRGALKASLDGSFDFGLAQEEYSDADSNDEIYD